MLHSKFEYHMFYVLYPFVTYLLSLPRTNGHQRQGEIVLLSFVNYYMLLLLELRGAEMDPLVLLRT
jgi:hypothetical protein